MTATIAPSFARPAPSVRESSALRGYLPSLDGWRAIAILLVVVDHAVGALRDSHPALMRFRLGFLGVYIFFGISGLLITTRLIEEQATRGGISLKGFFIRRAFRILPPLLAMLGIVGLAGAAGLIPMPLPLWLFALALLRNYTPPGEVAGHYPGWYTAHVWSLSVEEHFYLLWPAALLILGTRRAAKVAVCCVVLIAAWRIASIHWNLIPEVYGPPQWRSDTTLDAILPGGIIAVVLASAARRRQLARLLTQKVTAGLAISLPLLFLMWERWPLWEHPVRFLIPWIIPLMLAGTILRPRQLLGRFLELRPLRWIGRLSYSLYLWQQFFLAPHRPGHPYLSIVQTIPINIVGSLAVAVASYYLLERPLISLGHRLAKPPSPGRTDMRN